jgi:Neuraminidase (sialidase)
VIARRIFVFLVAALCALRAADFPLERHLTLAPGPGNPRNSEGDFIQLNGGRLLFIYTHFTTGTSDHAQAHLASRESMDAGKTWSAADQLVVANEGGYNVMSVSLLRLKSGPIALFYLRKNSLQDCRPVMRISRDEARTWSEPIECITENIGYYVLNNSRVIQLGSGRLVMPTALHEFKNGRLQPGRIVTHLSDDEGKTWRRAAAVLENDATGARVNLMEPGVVELESGHLLMLIRTQLGSQYSSESKDSGDTWSAPAPSTLLSPVSPATVKKLPSTGDLLVVWNDHTGQPEANRNANPRIRNPYAAALSRDGGKTWLPGKILEDQPGHGYCYTAMTFVGDRVLFAYCAHSSPNGLESTQISSFKVADLYR